MWLLIRNSRTANGIEQTTSGGARATIQYLKLGASPGLLPKRGDFSESILGPVPTSDRPCAPGLGPAAVASSDPRGGEPVGMLRRCGIIGHERNLRFDFVTARGPFNSGPTLTRPRCQVSEVIFTHPAAQFVVFDYEDASCGQTGFSKICPLVCLYNKNRGKIRGPWFAWCFN
jgi:hypothetical protein